MARPSGEAGPRDPGAKDAGNLGPRREGAAPGLAGQGDRMGLAVAAMLAAAVIASSSVVFIKASTMSPYLLAALRLLMAAALLYPAYRRELAARAAASLPPAGFLDALRRSALPGAVLALHFVTWIVGARLTSAANSTLIVNMVPVAMPFIAFGLDRVKPTPRELAATAVAVSGIVYLTSSDISLSAEYFTGDLVCFGSMLLFTIYLALGRRNNVDGRLWTYVVPLYAAGGFLCLAAALAIPGGTDGLSPVNIALAAGLAIGPTIVGHSTMNWAMTILRPQIVSIVNLSQFVSASLLALLFLGEKPAGGFYLTVPLILAGALLALYAPRKKRTA